jgi:hypothetical protein
MSRRESRETGALVYGAVPRAFLMPPEVALQKKEQGRRRGLVTAVIGVVALTVAGTVGSYFVAAGAEARLVEERRMTEQLLEQQLEFAEVTQVRGQLGSIAEVRGQLAEVEVLWDGTLAPYLAVLSANEQVKSLTFQSEAPAEPPLGLSGPLRSPRVATIKLVMVTADVPQPEVWYRAWEKLDTFADASIDAVTLLQAGYETAITINLNELTLSRRFADEEATE